MAGTRLVEVRSSLTDALAGLTQFGDARVNMTWKASPQKREQVFTTDARFTHAPASMKSGRTFRDETGRFNLVILVVGVNKDMTWTATRAVQMGTQAEEYIADHNAMDGTIAGLNSIIVEGDGQLAEMYADTSTIAELTYPIKYVARLT